MVRIQSSLDKFENTAVSFFYFILRSVLSLGIGFLTAKCTVLEDFSPFSIMLLSVSPKIGLVPTFCFLGSSLGYLTNSFELTVFKYITALTMIYIAYMVFQKSMHVIKSDTAILSAACCFTSGLLFLLVGNLNLFSILLLICESILVCCCIYFVNYAVKAFRKCCYLSSRELIAAAVTMILILVSLQNVSFFSINVTRVLAISILFLALCCLKTSHAAVLGCCLGIILAAVGNGGETIFTAMIVGTLAGCVFSAFSERLAMTSFIIAYYAVLFFFGKFPWNYWYFSEPPLAMALVFFVPKNRLRSFLSSYIAVKSAKGETANKTSKKLLEGCKQSCEAICPKASICYGKNIQELNDALEGFSEHYAQTEESGNIEELLPFCVKPHAMAEIVKKQLICCNGEEFDDLIEQLNQLSRKMEVKMVSSVSPIRFFADEEAMIRKELEQRKLTVRDINFIEDSQHCKKCDIAFSPEEDVLYEKILREVMAPYFNEGFTIKTAEKDGNYWAHIKEKSNFIISCAALCKNKSGEHICGDNALGFSLGKDTYCLLLADGMGSGTEAGYESKLAVDTVRKLLSGGLSVPNALNIYRSAERFRENSGFTTVDICVIDLKEGIAEFYKAGAYDSFFLHKDKLSVLRGGGMPLGISEHDRVKHLSIRISDGDFLIMGSDGLTAFNEQLESSILICKNENVRIYAQNILRQLSEISPEVTGDDITVIVSKFQKSAE